MSFLNIHYLYSANRRLIIQNKYYLLILGMVFLCLFTQQSNAGPANAIVIENAKPGTTAWQSRDLIHPVLPMLSGATLASTEGINVSSSVPCDPSKLGFPLALDDCVVGYTSAPSVNKGNSITFKVSVNPAPQTYSMNIYRMGWYGGTGATLVGVVPDQLGIKQPECPMDAQTGLTECNWSNSYTLKIPSTWTTGVYIAVIINQLGWKTDVLFVVRDDNRAADFLYQLPILTYAAYNNYPAGSLTGKSTYDSNSSGVNTVVGTSRAVKVSLDRPIHHQFGTWLGTDWSEIHLVSWLEKMGYNVNYATDLDVHTASPGFLESYKGIIVGGHGEYWTKSMYDKIELARSAGTNLAFFGANAVHWQVRMEKSSSGIANRVLVCYKDELNISNFDPIVNPQLKTMKWRDLGRAEQTLIGVQHDINGWNLDTFNQLPFIVKNSSHWVYLGTALKDNSPISHLIGYEVDNFDDEYPKPSLLTPTSQTIIGESPFINHSSSDYISQASIYQAPSGAWVFGSGTMSWSWALARQASTSVVTPNAVYQNADIQQVTQNILDTYVKAPIESLEAKVLTVYRDANYSGISQHFGFGKYRADHKELAIVSDNTISSFKIKAGYSVKMCANIPPLAGECKTYKADTASLVVDNFDNQISYIEVSPRLNLSLGKKATQSSTYRAVAVAGRAVDGDTDGNYADNSVSVTNKDMNAWWQVDLARQSAVRNIVLGGMNCCAHPLANFYVFVSKTNLTGRSFSSIVNDASIWRYQMRGQAGSSLSIAANVSGRYVRVQLADQNFLALREVLVR